MIDDLEQTCLQNAGSRSFKYDTDAACVDIYVSDCLIK